MIYNSKRLIDDLLITLIIAGIVGITWIFVRFLFGLFENLFEKFC